MEKTDLELVESYYQGDPQAFEALFQRHKDKVFNFALKLLNNRPEAEDVTSEVFIQLFGKRYQNQGKAQVTTWLFTVARNNCLSRLRSLKHTASLWFKNRNGQDEEWDIADTRESARDAIDQKEKARQVKRALNNLPVEQKEALVLREYFQKDYAEIAQILECSLDKVKVLIFRARENLRKQLLPVLKEDGS
jgi:RNA polymerase sigma-70 factor (ECF subfamily)